MMNVLHCAFEILGFHKRKCNFTGSDVIIMNNEYLPPTLVVG